MTRRRSCRAKCAACCWRGSSTALEPRVVLDAGAGTGEGARALKRRYPRAQVLAVDFAPEMLGIARTRA